MRELALLDFDVQELRGGTPETLRRPPVQGVQLFPSRLVEGFRAAVQSYSESAVRVLDNLLELQETSRLGRDRQS